MNYNNIGRSGVKASKISLGTMNFGMVTDKKEAFNILDEALDCGINYIDTSNSYGGYDNRGESERIIGEWIKTRNVRSKVFLATKVYSIRENVYDNPNDEKGISIYKINTDVRESLKRLNTDYIDLYYLHHTDPNCTLEEIADGMERLFVSGIINYIGTSNYSVYDLMKLQNVFEKKNNFGILCEQHRYNLMCRYPEVEMIGTLRKMGIGLVVWGPLMSGLLAGNFDFSKNNTRSSHNKVGSEDKKKLERYIDLCRKYDVKPSVLSLAWLLQNDVVSTILIGPRTVNQLRECILSLNYNISEELNKEIGDIFPGFEMISDGKYCGW